jgi:hypothetical protein
MLSACLAQLFKKHYGYGAFEHLAHLVTLVRRETVLREQQEVWRQ